MSTVTTTGIGETLSFLESLGKEGDRIAAQAATQTAQSLRANTIAKLISQRTGVPAAAVKEASTVRAAKASDPTASIVFSSSGIPVHMYRYRMKSTRAPTRAQILVNWVAGGEKLAAGFINPRGKRRAPLSTRYKGAGKPPKPRGALGPSIAAAYRTAQDEILPEAQQQLENRVIALLVERSEL